MPGPVSVVIPAHNEAAIIAATVRRLVDGDAEGRLELVVVVNGSTDATAEAARRVSPRVNVVEIPEASKIAALNAGDAAAHAFPRVYLDADIVVSAEALLAVADALGTDAPPYIGAPRLDVDTSGANLLVRCYYRIWELTDYRAQALVGAGVFVLSEAGRRRFGDWPQVIADDLYAQRHFPPAERISLAEHEFTVRAPHGFAAFLRRQTRITAGNHEIAQRFPELDDRAVGSGVKRLLGRVIRRPALWGPASVYLVANLYPRIRARRVRGDWRRQGWNRDESTRVADAH